MTQNRVRFTVNTSAAFIVNLLRIQQVNVYQLKEKQGACAFSVRGRDGECVRELLCARGKEYRIERSTAWKDRRKKALEKAGVIAAIILWIFLGLVWSGVLTEIRVSGCERISEEEIKRVITEEIALPTWKKKIDRKETERMLVGLEGVANASVEIKGNVMYVRILEELEKPEIVDYSEKTDILSAYDGVITGLIVFSGEARKKVGDTVRKGDVLIASTQTDAEGNVTDIRATGSVYGRVWVSEEYIFPEHVVRMARTGREKIYVVGRGCKKKIDPGFSTFEREEIPIGNNGIYKKIVYYETKPIYEKFDYDAQKESIREEKTRELGNAIDEAAVKTRTWFSEKTVDKTTHLVIYYEIVVSLIRS